MKKSLQIALNRGDRIYVNGAVIKVDRRVSLEFMNDVTFLLQQHVLKAEQATTPLRQLYFLIQAIIIDPRPDNPANEMSRAVLAELARASANVDLLAGLAEVAGLFERERYYDALRGLRALYPIEASVLGSKLDNRVNVGGADAR